MRIATDAPDILFEDGRAPTIDLEPIIENLRAAAPHEPGEWRVLSARRKLGKTLFEIEEARGGETRRLVGKVAKAERCDTLVDALRKLWEAGWRPPNRNTVTEAVSWLTGEGAVLQELAPGKQAIDIMLDEPDRAEEAAALCAAWLGALHGTRVDAPPSRFDAGTTHQHARELTERLPRESGRIRSIAEAIADEAARPEGERVPTHGDFHAMNIFIDGDRRVTGIDLDKFGLREREADAGYFLSQTASFGYFKTQRFDDTLAARRVFLRRYEECEKIRRRRAAMYMAAAFLKNLHFELVLLDTGRTQYVTPWLFAAERAMVEEDLEFSGAVR